MTDQSWRQHAACRGLDTDDFYPQPNTPASSMANALLACARCPVADACFDDANESGDWFGIRGGISGDRRRRMAIRGRWKRNKRARRAAISTLAAPCVDNQKVKESA